jgi:hypothetical protein
MTSPVGSGPLPVIFGPMFPRVLVSGALTGQAVL